MAPKKPTPKKKPAAKKTAARGGTATKKKPPPATGKKKPAKPVTKKPAPKVAPGPSPGPASSPGYDRHREEMAARSRERSAKGRDIGPLPAVADPDRRERCKASLREFALTYFPARFFWPFARPHLAALEKLERCIRGGGLFALAMPRGSGKTALAEVAALWALLYGYRRFLVIVAADDTAATKILKKLQGELEGNDALLADFPEAVYPIRRLERITKRAQGQTLDGRPTLITFTADQITLPAVAGSACSGSTVHVTGCLGSVRGLAALGPDGSIFRPDIVLIDDAQTRTSAKSPTQTGDRERVINDDVLGLAGPNVRIAAVQLCTVIYPDDLSDRHLNHDKHPEWQGQRTRMLEAWPENLALWDEYGEVRRESLRSGDEGRRATEFYRENREAMDRGAVVSWPERMKPGEISGIQSAMNVFVDNPRGFRAEFQNEPEKTDTAPGAKELDPDAIMNRLSGLPRYAVPRESVRLTAFIDPGERVHFYAVCAWDDRFGGSIVDYGCWPRQNRAFFAYTDARPPLADAYPNRAYTAAVYAGLVDLTAEILGRAYVREVANDEVKVERCLVDCGWEAKTVYQFVRATTFPVYPSKGIGRTTTSRGVSEWKPRPGERSGHHWRLTISETGRGQMVQFDPDAWKTRLFEQLTAPLGSPGTLTLYGKAPGVHEMIGHHLAAEYSEPVTIRGATFDKWRKLPHDPDNHLLDCVVGSALAASVTGLTWSATGTPEPPKPKKKKIDIEAQWKAARGIA